MQAALECLRLHRLIAGDLIIVTEIGSRGILLRGNSLTVYTMRLCERHSFLRARLKYTCKLSAQF